MVSPIVLLCCYIYRPQVLLRQATTTSHRTTQTANIKCQSSQVRNTASHSAGIGFEPRQKRLERLYVVSSGKSEDNTLTRQAMYVYSNKEERSRNHCCRGKGKNYYTFVCARSVRACTEAHWHVNARAYM